ncbi:uncharacterized protein A1O5_00912 [Cladophialophora psammophila CBS 110553]|uniref:Carboxylic ester hydrolase n=1 Tax=Cladophialophora psammophila CBS 110553 TaxID=1182543 RepID=W9Y1S6_9EURO|nr:uncharacterized protein A1O5_00912 [Cladophialophora psammophila CBS 110553]EXJ76404.1 hypothetical protein A1O5_00912 [Cladophialophora psammophila CBS 110553]
MTAVIQHPKLGCIRGRDDGDVVQCLGLKYATLSDRFATAVLFDEKAAGEIQATEPGPGVISLPEGCVLEQGLIQQSLPVNDLSFSELHGLNLNITIPKGSRTNLPVFAFIHGGGFGMGSNAWPQYDLKNIVRLSLKNGTPVLGININYRLGVLGYLTSQELREAGYESNNGIRDQRIAFEWIRTHAPGFGGDPGNVTVVGESAGAISCSLHLQSHEELFQRAMIMSGTFFLFKPLPLPVAEVAYQSTLKALGLDQLAPPERLKALLQVPTEQLYASIQPEIPLFPVADGHLVHRVPTFGQIATQDSSFLPGKFWTQGIMIGDCQFDASIFAILLGPRRKGIAEAFETSIQTSLQDHQGLADAILNSYGIRTARSDEEAMSGILKFINDIAFDAPLKAFCEGWPEGKAFVYCFNVGNPWEGPGKGQATHILDIAFLFQNYNDFLTTEQKAVAEQFGSHFISFICGEAPFPSHVPGKGGAMVYGSPSEATEFVLSDRPEDVGRRSIISSIATEYGMPDTALDAMSAALDRFVAGY